MKQEKIELLSRADGLRLDVLLTDTQKDRRGVIQIVHGMAEYKERYLPFMNFMAHQGYTCIIHDHRGHGKSIKQEEDLGYFYGAGGEALVEDAHEVTRYIKERYPDLPLILLGHSMGSLVVRNYIKKYDSEIDMLINSGAPCKNAAVLLGMGLVKAQKIFWGDRHRSPLIQTLAFGGYAMRFPREKSPYAWTCSDVRVVEEYDASEKCGFTFTLDGFWGLFALLRGAYSAKGWQVGNPGLPILFLAGDEDPCVGSERKMKEAMRFLKKRGYMQVSGKRYPGMRHEILNETGKEEVYRNILSYIEKH